MLSMPQVIYLGLKIISGNNLLLCVSLLTSFNTRKKRMKKALSKVGCVLFNNEFMDFFFPVKEISRNEAKYFSPNIYSAWSYLLLFSVKREAFLEETGFYKAVACVDTCFTCLPLTVDEGTGAFAFIWHRITPASLQAQNLFGTFIFCFPCLAEIPSTHRRSITSLCKGPAPSQSPPLAGAVLCLVKGSGQWAAHKPQTHPFHALSHFWVSTASPCSCWVMKTLHSAS